MSHHDYTHFEPVEFSQIELIELGDPKADQYPDGYVMTTVQCNDCGAYTNDGDESHVQHHASCVAGEAKKWQRYYEKFAEEEAAGLYPE